MSWKDVRTYRSRESVEHEVNGARVRFYPNRMRLLPELTELAVPIGKALAELLDPSRSESGMTEKIAVQGDTTVKEYSTVAASPELVKARSTARDAALEALLKAAGDPKNRLMLGRLLMDSMADLFPYAADRPAADVEAFLYEDGGIDLPMLADLVAGWIKANSKQFSSVGEMIAARAGVRLGGVEAAPESPTASPSTTPAPSDGSSSRTPSSPASPLASS
jgi:hypothetical protein